MSFKPQTPFVPVPVKALELIEQSLELSAAASAKAVLLALYRICLREKCHSVRKPLAYIGVVASLNARTVMRRIPDLERLGLVMVTRPALRTENTYTLPQADKTLSHDERTLSPDVVTVKGPLAVTLPKEEEEKNPEGCLGRSMRQAEPGTIRKAFCEELITKRS